MRTLFIICFLLSMTIPALAEDEADREIQQLEKLERDRDRAKQEKDTVVAEEKSILKELRGMEKTLSSREKELRIYEHNLAKCERDIEQLGKALAEAELRLKQTRALMQKRLRAMYKFGYQGGQLSYLKLLLGAEDISELITRYKYMTAIAAADKELMEKVMAEKAEIEFKKEQVEARRRRILEYKAGAERVRREILVRRRRRQATLDRLGKSKDYLTRSLTELGEAVSEKQELITRLRSDSSEEPDGEAADLGERRGGLLWPVSGKIVRNFAPSMKGVTIQAEYGADIWCVASGTVEYAQWFDGVGFGQMVIIDHGNGYRTLYAHASELLVEKGQKVNQGQTIARVGDTGSLIGPVLYFEVWKGTRAMNTRQWLK